MNPQLSTALTPRIIFEDTHLVVLSKPAGLLSQGEATGDANLVDWLRGYFGRNYVGLVHRLDRNTSGIMVAAKRSKSADRLSDALREGTLERTYLAWVQGTLEAEKRWEHVLEKDERTNTVRVVKDGAGGGAGKKSALTVSPVERSQLSGTPISLVSYRLETGRSHQIRVQSAHEGFPLVGDVKYGKKLEAGLRDFGRPALHSHRLTFPHPMSKEVLRFEDPLPDDLAVLVGRNSAS